MTREYSLGMINRLKSNKRIFEITLSELQKFKKEKGKINKFTYPETLETDRYFSINYSSNIYNIRYVLKLIRGHLRDSNPITRRVRTSPLVKERKEKLEEHLLKLRALRSQRKKKKRGKLNG